MPGESSFIPTPLMTKTACPSQVTFRPMSIEIDKYDAIGFDNDGAFLFTVTRCLIRKIRADSV